MKQKQLGPVPSSVTDPRLREFLTTMKEIIDLMQGHGRGDAAIKEKRPTVQDLIDANITNADQID